MLRRVVESVYFALFSLIFFMWLILAIGIIWIIIVGQGTP